MWVYLMRHGDAVDARLAGGDEARWLTEFGREESLRTARELKERVGNVERIFSSPYVRAAQTAELAATVLGDSTEFTTLDALVPEGNPSMVIDALSALDPSIAVLLAGHEPSMHHIAGALTGQGNFPSFEKSEITAIEWTPGTSGRFAWRVT